MGYYLQLKYCRRQCALLPYFKEVRHFAFRKILIWCQNQASASDLPLYDIFVPQKVFLLKISDDVIACDLWFEPPLNQKFWLRL